MDGDCILEDGWISAGLAAMDQNADMGIVTGWCVELLPDASVYNGMADFDWRRPSGDSEACGGNMMVRCSIFEDLGGFNPHVIASEDDEFCIRVGKSGRRVHLLPVAMVKHDSNMMRFEQWWRRAIRTGHGFAQVGALHPSYFLRSRQRVWFFGAVLPLAALVSLLLSLWLLVPILGLYAVSYIRTVRGLSASGLAPRKAFLHSVFLSMSKFPNLIGMLIYHWRTLRGGDMAIIEYK
jgi:GT2 family glycosyltransferase